MSYIHDLHSCPFLDFYFDHVLFVVNFHSHQACCVIIGNLKEIYKGTPNSISLGRFRISVPNPYNIQIVVLIITSLPINLRRSIKKMSSRMIWTFRAIILSPFGGTILRAFNQLSFFQNLRAEHIMFFIY